MISEGSLRRVFVVGCPRSGTTVIQSALARETGLLTLPETHFFVRLLGSLDDWRRADDGACERRWYRRLAYAAGALRGVRRSLPESLTMSRHVSGRAYVAQFLQELDAAARAAQCGGWIEKTPDHEAYTDLIAALCPGALFVHVLRRGEDVVASAVDAEMAYAEHEAFRGGVAYWVERWNRAAVNALSHVGRPGHLVVCHEDLVADPDGTLARLRAFAAPAAAKRPGAPARPVADLRHEPWKRDAVAGRVQHSERKFEAVFGPQTQRWVRSHLVDHAALRAEIERRQQAISA